MDLLETILYETEHLKLAHEKDNDHLHSIWNIFL